MAADAALFDLCFTADGLWARGKCFGVDQLPGDAGPGRKRFACVVFTQAFLDILG